MPTANNTQPPVLDPSAGESALHRIEPVLRAMSAAELIFINVDPQDAAIAALALVDVARDPVRLARLKSLPASIVPADLIEQLELTAFALWFTHVKLQTESTQATRVRVDAALYEASGAHLAKMLKLIDYHVGELPEVARELSDIRSGTGYQDRASDLVRTASLWEKHRPELQNDTRNFDANDATQARKYAESIIQEMRASMDKSAAEWTDLRQRAGSRLMFLYNELKAAGEFVFRAEPEHRDRFVSLRTALGVSNKKRAQEAPSPATAPSNGKPAVASGV